MKRMATTVAALALLASVTAGCAGGESPSSQKAEQGNGGAEKKDVTIKIFQSKVEISEALNKLKEEYEKTHPGVKLQVETVIGTDYGTALKTKFAAGEMPDIFNNEGHQQLEVWKDRVEDLSDQPWVKDVYEFAKKPMTRDGKMYGMPVNVEGYGLVYNKELFAKANITTLPKTLTELEQVSEKIQASGTTPYVNMFQLWSSLGRQFFNNPMSKQADPDAFIKSLNDGTVKFSGNPLFKDSTKLLDVIVKYGNKNQMTTDYNNLIATFGNGQAAMMQSGNWTLPLLQKINPNISVGLMPMPLNDDVALNDKLFVDVPNNWVVSKESKVKAEAKEFLNWLVTSETGKTYITKEFKFIPAFTSFEADPASVGTLGEDVSKYMKDNKVLGWQWPKYPDGVAQESASAFQKYVAGRLNQEQLLAEIQTIWDSKAKQQK
ncbi:raffinose/stachyose/melibiose transport system substrate-binding protein [Paenibacillus sp. UNCCL117]|uniref:ABC transporter substrate-binding protein n=1 Tax=unclassified Paenibacillus TaxID=185978 RepID=UPI000891EF5A|nr:MULTISPECIES: ABC transporter substrate-binding protein [unclassified Paenibacillus]SDE56176.1 raffinose/stachyose/melibiose transport system substrate-binding protein [Paenibacillus sp. cl123]SFW66246.1 raffinose/stachyose/melibiose transport system substrate-binding protein [Paenibacillus sp. UNCCL117]